MNKLTFEFEASPWELTLEGLTAGDRLSAARFLTLMEDEQDADVEGALDALEERGVTLDLTDLPRPAGTGEAALRLRREAELVAADQLPQGLEKNDPLRLYLEEVAAVPACGDEAVLAAECAAGKEDSREKLVNLCLSRVIQIARDHVGKGVLLMDLIQEGSLGLWQGILQYHGGDFPAFRDWWIRQYMAKLITLQARSNGVGAKMRQALEDYRSVDDRLLCELGRNPTLEEIALELHMTPEEAETVAKMLENARQLEQAMRVVEGTQEEDPDEEQAVEDTAYFQSRQRINDLLSDLSEREAELLTLRFGLEGGLPLSPEDTGRKLGMTPEEVVKTEAAALAKLRES